MKKADKTYKTDKEAAQQHRLRQARRLLEEHGFVEDPPGSGAYVAKRDPGACADEEGTHQ